MLSLSNTPTPAPRHKTQAEEHEEKKAERTEEYGSTGTKRQVGDPAECLSSNILVTSLVKVMLRLSFLERSMLYWFNILLLIFSFIVFGDRARILEGKQTNDPLGQSIHLTDENTPKSHSESRSQ